MSTMVFRWSGEAMEVLPRFAREADKRFVVGQTYVLEEIQERSAASHRHYFAAINEAFLNLPESIAAQWATSEHLRRFCLIKAGFHNHRSIVASSKAEARRLAAFVKPMDEFAIVSVNECVVNVYTAQSQSHRAMGKQDFQRSKDAVLEILNDLIGVKSGELESAGEPA
jgi:hypothetical protein